MEATLSCGPSLIRTWPPPSPKPPRSCECGSLPTKPDTGSRRSSWPGSDERSHQWRSLGGHELARAVRAARTAGNGVGQTPGRPAGVIQHLRAMSRGFHLRPRRGFTSAARLGLLKECYFVTTSEVDGVGKRDAAQGVPVRVFDPGSGPRGDLGDASVLGLHVTVLERKSLRLCSSLRWQLGEWIPVEAPTATPWAPSCPSAHRSQKCPGVSSIPEFL